MRLPRPAPPDVAAAIAFLAASVVVVATGSAEPRAALVFVPLPAAAALAWRTRMPLEAMAIGGAGAAACALAGLVGVDNLVNVLAILLLTYAVGSHEQRSRARAGLAVSLLALVALATTAEEVVGTIVFGAAFFCVVPWVLGRAVRRRGELVRELEEKGRELERRRAASARIAIQEERTRLARELHEVIARSLTSMAHKAERAERDALEHPNRARTAAVAIESTGRGALTELRGLLGVLHGGDESPTGDPEDREAVPA